MTTLGKGPKNERLIEYKGFFLFALPNLTYYFSILSQTNLPS